MLINADSAQKVVLNTQEVPWVPSPMAGRDQKILECEDAALAPATSLVRYAPGALVAAPHHTLGEEWFVLHGMFYDAAGQYPTGTYLNSPAETARTCCADEGCTLFVKRRPRVGDDSERLVVHTAVTAWCPGLVPGLSVLPLSAGGTTSTALVRWAPGTYFNPHRHFGGEEIYVLEGVFEDEHGRYPAGYWLRSPHLSAHKPFSVEGCTIFVKTGHLLPL